MTATKSSSLNWQVKEYSQEVLDLKDEEKAALIKVLKSHKRAIAWKLSDIKGVDPEFCTYKILMEEDYEPTVQSQIRVNPKIHDVIKKEVEKLLDAGLIYPISDSPWYAIDYRKLNEATREDTSMAFHDSNMPRKNSRGNQYYVSSMDSSVILQIPIDRMTKKKDKHSLAITGTFMQWILLLQEFDVEIRDEKRSQKILAAVSLQNLKKPSQNGRRTRKSQKHFHTETLGLVALRNDNAPWWKENQEIHDAKIKNRVFNIGDQVLLFNSRLKIFSGKLKSRWSGPFTVTQVFPYGTVELSQNSGPNFKVNGHRLKHYFGGDIPTEVVLDLQTFPKDQ
ncbi:hypothetical protein Tco_1182750 [Tanacetum coccineum]